MKSLPLGVARRAPLHLDGFRQPAVVTGLVLMNEQPSLHLVVAPAAQLGAGQVPDLVVAVLVLLVAPALARDPLAVGGVAVGPEPDRDHLARDGVLLEAHIRQKEAMQN